VKDAAFTKNHAMITFRSFTTRDARLKARASAPFGIRHSLLYRHD